MTPFWHTALAKTEAWDVIDFELLWHGLDSTASFGPPVRWTVQSEPLLVRSVGTRTVATICPS